MIDSIRLVGCQSEKSTRWSRKKSSNKKLKKNRRERLKKSIRKNYAGRFPAGISLPEKFSILYMDTKKHRIARKYKKKGIKKNGQKLQAK